ncbi:MAG: nitrilase [Alphaproteobacteria bacterium]|nr:MAG: nitrilase [Alphaproteobacteria bacterium]
MEAYYALAFQALCEGVNACPDRPSARKLMMASIDRLGGQIRAAKMFIGPDLRLVVLPEYFLTAYPQGETIATWADKACIEMDGPEYEALGRIASDNDIFLSGNAYELDPHFPGLYFQTSFIIAPSGKVILRYRRLNSMFAPTPHDVWDRYLNRYGLEGVFPVADTEIGKLAAIASEEILYPEIARCLALRGAEIFLHSSSEIGSPAPTPKSVAKTARAIENMAYVVSANSGGITGTGLPKGATDGNSKIVDYKGLTLCESNPGETMTAFAEIDLAALRRHRRRPGMGNYLARQRLELFVDLFAQTQVHPANTMLDDKGDIIAPDREHFLRIQKEIIARRAREGKI